MLQTAFNDQKESNFDIQNQGEYDIADFENLTSEEQRRLFRLLNKKRKDKKGRKFKKKNSVHEGARPTNIFHKIDDKEKVSLPQSVLQFQCKQKKDEFSEFVVRKKIAEGFFSKVKLLGEVERHAELSEATVSVESKWVVKIQEPETEKKSKNEKKRLQLKWKKNVEKEFQITALFYPEAMSFFRKYKHYLVMRKLPGELFQKISTNDFIEIMDMYIAICEALEKVHKKGIVHRDLSFSNIFYDKDRKKAYIFDFGLSKRTNEVDDEISGNQIFIAPEAIEENTDVSSDIFSFNGMLAASLKAKDISKDRGRLLRYPTPKNLENLKTKTFNLEGMFEGVTVFGNKNVSETTKNELYSFLKRNTAIKKSQRSNLKQMKDKLRAAKYYEIAVNLPHTKELLEIFNLIQKRIDKLEQWSLLNSSEETKANLLRELQDEIVDPKYSGNPLKTILKEWEGKSYKYLYCGKEEKDPIENRIVIGAHRNCLFTPPLTATQILIKRLYRQQYGDIILEWPTVNQQIDDHAEKEVENGESFISVEQQKFLNL